MFRAMILCLMLLCAAVSFINAQVNQEWVAMYGSSSSFAVSVVVDRSCNIYVTGESNSHLVTIKYNPQGNPIWIASYDSGYCYIPVTGRHHIALDLEGNVYVTASINANQTGRDYTTIKYNSQGMEQWVARYDGPGNDEDYPRSIVVDYHGNVYVTGYSDQEPYSSTDYDYATVKYDSSGNQLWVARYQGQYDQGDYATDIVVDSNGNVYVTGQTATASQFKQWATIKYNSIGWFQWVQYKGISGSQNGASAMILDNEENIIVTGTTNHDQNVDYTTVSYDRDGNELWISYYDGPIHSGDSARDITKDCYGNIYVTGESCGLVGQGMGNYREDIATIKYDAAGNQLWEARYIGSPYTYSKACPYDMITDNSGNVYVIGRNTGDLGRDYLTIMYTTNGVEQWRARYGGNSSETVQSIAVDRNSNVYVTGGGYLGNRSDCFATVKYNQNPNPTNSISPISPPIIIPANGGSFQYILGAQNPNRTPTISSFWNQLRSEMGIYYSVRTRIERDLPGGATPTRILTQTIADTIPAGTYDFISYIGIYPEYIQDSSSFAITKLATTDGNPWITESACSGDFFDEFANADVGAHGMRPSGSGQQGVQLNAPTQPTSTDLRLSVSPNPFNPTTTIRFDLPQAGKVTLEVFDINGRNVGAHGMRPAIGGGGGAQGARSAPLQEWYPAGTHEIPFDGSGLPSGIYVYRLTAGSQQALGKMVLLK